MGCGGGKEEKEVPATQAEMKAEHAKREKASLKKKMCEEIVTNLDKNENGRMDLDEIQVLVKNMYPRFINIEAKDITAKDPEMKALDQMSKDMLIEHLVKEMQDGWVQAFHQFLGLSGSEAAENKVFTPGVYEVKWEGGVRFRKSNVYVDISDIKDKDGKVPMAEIGQSYRIRHFCKGVKGAGAQQRATEVVYGYIEWARLFIPMSFPDGSETMLKVAEIDDAEQLKRMAGTIYDKMDALQKKDDDQHVEGSGVKPQVLLQYLDGAQIGYDHESLADHLSAADENSDGLVQKAEFIDCFVTNGSISDCLWTPTHGNDKKPHPESVAELFAAENNKWFASAGHKVGGTEDGPTADGETMEYEGGDQM